MTIYNNNTTACWLHNIHWKEQMFEDLFWLGPGQIRYRLKIVLQIKFLEWFSVRYCANMVFFCKRFKFVVNS